LCYQKGAAAPFFIELHPRMTSSSHANIRPFWLGFLSCLMAIAYVLPNHYLPWMAFHAEAWTAMAMLAPAGWVVFCSSKRPSLNLALWICVGLTLLAVLQFATGLVPFKGTAWIVNSYFCGSVLAVMVGDMWEQEAPGQALDYVALALTLAAIVSFPIQVMQWLGLTWETPLIVMAASLQRPAANLAQPNLLADLFLMATVAVSWLRIQGRLPVWLALAIASLFLLGTALTGSRAAWINVLAMSGMVLYGNMRLKGLPTPRTVAVLCLVFFIGVFSGPSIQQRMTPLGGGGYTLDSSNARMSAWNMMFNAVWERPWTGYGLGQIVRVNFVFENNFGMERALYNQSHNIALDLILWLGIPIGVVALLLLCRLLWVMVRVIPTLHHWHATTIVLIAVVHSLVEFPLQYTFFLFPIALLIGTLYGSSIKVQHSLAAVWSRTLWCFALFVVVCLVRDYALVERNFYALRFESRGLETSEPKAPPDTWVLDQMRENLRVSRLNPGGVFTAQEFEKMEQVVRLTPGPFIMLKLAMAYALNEQPEKAQFWLSQICNKTNLEQCEVAQNQWERALINDKHRSLGPWPQSIRNMSPKL
jgi:O-antigen ligase